MDVRFSKTKWILMLLSLVIQSTVGISLSLTCIWAHKVKMIVLIGEANAEFFFYFAVGGFIINMIILGTSFLSLTTHVADLIVARHRENRRRLLYQNNDSRTYGAFGYYSLV